MVSRATTTYVTALAAVAWFGTACGERPAGPDEVPAPINAENLDQRIRVLAADSMEGRAPASAGEERTVAYLEREFRRMGLEPANGDRYTQDVPLVSLTTDPAAARFTVRGDGGTSRFTYGPEYMAWTTRVVASVDVDHSEMIFVGYGIVAPEYNWNDYEGLDVAGKTVVMLVNDPGFTTQDPDLFTGEAMTYYGRWTYKYEEAARQGAAAAIIVHETDPASYPWAVVRNSWTGEQFDLVRSDSNMSRVAVEGWVTLETARVLFERARLDFETVKQEAATREFRPRPMRLQASFSLRNTIRHSTSRNVAGTLRGSERPDEYVIVMAHWDHLGVDSSLEGDAIYNGAQDNATGTAGLLVLAEAFAAAEPAPERSLVFLAVTAEEQGLLGSAHYVENPLVPLDHSVAAINMDVMNVYGPMRDITVIGLGQSELDEYVAAAAEGQDRRIRPDPNPSAGSYYRSDHFNFAKVGVPALYPDVGVDHVERGEAWTREQMDRYEAERYHKPSDAYEPEWDLRGAVQDLALIYRVGVRLTTEDAWPTWKDGSEFKATRDSMMTARQ
jgi:Zn-dependent M28 family amino/carboxypeptidase